ncbi:MAG: outer membrane protein assembly factor BamE [Bacteroides sp.]|nr:outer membrane protein assembly factor BamE [Bacteroides sp.]
MKKAFYLIAAFLIVGCGSYNTLDLRKLTTGMTKQEVRDVIGPPDRVLSVNESKDGYQEVLEYRASRNEVYALEFWNNYLTGYEHLYDDVNYYPPVVPPLYYPEYGRPLIYYNPGYNRPPSRPVPPTRPTPPARPSTTTNTRRSESNRTNTERPTENVRPQAPAERENAGSSSGNDRGTTTNSRRSSESTGGR